MSLCGRCRREIWLCHYPLIARGAALMFPVRCGGSGDSMSFAPSLLREHRYAPTVRWLPLERILRLRTTR